jgi:hypothetical protein
MSPLLPESLLASVVLVREQRLRIRDLKGFRKSHQVPTEINDHTNSFVGRIAAEDLNEELNVRFDEFRKALKLKRTELTVQDPEAGTASITAPYFLYQITARQAEDDAASAVIRRQLGQIRDPESLKGPGCSMVFGSAFDTVEYMPAHRLDLASFVDEFEDREVTGATLDYDRQLTWCQLVIPGAKGFLRMTADVISVVLTQPQSPDALLATFLAFYARVGAWLDPGGAGADKSEPPGKHRQSALPGKGNR